MSVYLTHHLLWTQEDHWRPSLKGLPRRREGGEEPFVGDKLKEEAGEVVLLS